MLKNRDILDYNEGSPRIAKKYKKYIKIIAFHRCMFMLHNTIFCGFGSLTSWPWKKYEPTVPEAREDR
jgi:hypothetical protein